MSKLDDILNNPSAVSVIDFRNKAKSEIKALFLELVGKNEVTKNPNGESLLIDIRNDYKQQLRDKVNEL